MLFFSFTLYYLYIMFIYLKILIFSFQAVFIYNMDHKTIQIAYKSTHKIKYEINIWNKLDKENKVLDKV